MDNRSGVPGDLDSPRFGPPVPYTLADLDPPPKKPPTN